MHPVLFEAPWPALGIPLWPAYLLVAGSGIAVAVIGVRREFLPMAVWGAAAALAALIAWFAAPGARLVGAPLLVRTWGVALALALGVGAWLWVRLGVRAGLSRASVAGAASAAFLGGLIGARLVWILLHTSAVGSVAGVFAFHDGGLSAWGALAGGTLAAYLVAARNDVPALALLDAAVPSFAAGVVLVRVGCWLEGCDFGVPLEVHAPRVLETLGTFPKGSPAWATHVLERGLSPSSEHSLPVHPVPLYEAGGGILLSIPFLLRGRARTSGAAFAGTMLGYLVLRVSLDSLREDGVEILTSVALFAATLLGAALLAARRFRRARK